MKMLRLHKCQGDIFFCALSELSAEKRTRYGTEETHLHVGVRGDNEVGGAPMNIAVDVAIKSVKVKETKATQARLK